MKYTFYIIFIALISSCADSTTVENNENEIPVATTAEGLQILPLLPLEKKQTLLENTDYIDYIFYPYGKSINQGDKGSIRKMIQQITDVQQPTIDCAAPFCKITFYKMPNILIEADVHYGNGCAFFVFHDSEGAPEYANQMGDFGITFFNKIITQFEGK